MTPADTREVARLREWAVAGILPGALGGALLASLLFQLNPDLPFRALPLLRTISFLTLVGATLSLLLHIPLARAAGLNPWRLLPWTVTIVLGAAALLHWVHASQFSFYLPPESGNRLIRTAFVLSAATLLTFYTALLHSLQKRRYGLRSRLLLCTLAAITIVVAIGRRTADDPRKRVDLRTIVSEGVEAPRLVVVGIDAASLDAILPLAEQGQLPFLADLMQQGAYGRLVSIQPIDRLPVWYSLATGQYPFKHGLVSADVRSAPFISTQSRIDLLPIGLAMSSWGHLLGMRPAHSTRQHSLALWEILERQGARTVLVGWPAPDESLFRSHAVVTEGFFATQAAGAADGPPDFLTQVIGSRLAPEDVDPALLARFGAEIDDAVREGIAQDLWREEVARQLLADPETDAVFVHLPGLLEVARRYFGGYMAVQFEGLRGTELDRASHIVRAYYLHLDEALSRIWSSIEGPRLMVVVSAWGTEPAGVLQHVLSSVRGTGRSEAGRFDRAPDGVLLLLGESLSSGTFLDHAELIDVTPTVLYRFGLPIARDLDGQVLTKSFGATFLNRAPLTFVPAYPER